MYTDYPSVKSITTIDSASENEGMLTPGSNPIRRYGALENDLNPKP